MTGSARTWALSPVGVLACTMTTSRDRDSFRKRMTASLESTKWESAQSIRQLWRGVSAQVITQGSAACTQYFLCCMAMLYGYYLCCLAMLYGYYLCCMAMLYGYYLCCMAITYAMAHQYSLRCVATRWLYHRINTGMQDTGFHGGTAGMQQAAASLHRLIPRLYG
jgi:hypothetical protein